MSFFTKRMTVGLLWGVYLVSLILSGVLDHMEKGSIYKYELGKNSKFAEAIKKDTWTSAVTSAGEDATAITGNLENCGIAARPMWVSQADESVIIHTGIGINGIKVYDCLSQKSGSDDDDDAGTTNCKMNVLIPSQFKQERFVSDDLQRLMPCPLSSDDKMQCPAEADGGNYIEDPTTSADFDDCSEHRVSSACISSLKFYTEGYKLWHELMSIFFAVFLVLLTLRVFANDKVENYSSEAVAEGLELFGLLGVIAVHVTLVVIILMRLVYTNSIGEEDGDCLGDYLENKLGYTLEESSNTGDTAIGASYMVAVVLGVVFVLMNQCQPDDAEKLGRK